MRQSGLQKRGQKRKKITRKSLFFAVQTAVSNPWKNQV